MILVTGSLAVIKLYVGQLAAIQILAADEDTDQVVRCRWSYQVPLDECGNVCYDLPNSVLSPVDCAVTWTAALQAADVANNLTQSTYVIAITAEDFT